MRSVVIGIGNPYRSDDGAGPAVAGLIRSRDPGVEVVEHDGEPAGLLDAWTGFDLAVIVDAVRTGLSRPGEIHHLEVDGTAGALPAGAPSTHGLGPGDAIGLARALGRLPHRLVIYGIEGAAFDPGVGLSPEVSAAVEEVASRITADLEATET